MTIGNNIKKYREKKGAYPGVISKVNITERVFFYYKTEVILCQ